VSSEFFLSLQRSNFFGGLVGRGKVELKDSAFSRFAVHHGRAAVGFHDAMNKFPTGKGASYGATVPGAPVYARWSVHSQLLP
jgi:predicted ATPase